MKLILIGGAHGVGKTTLLEYTIQKFQGRISLFDPGEFFWKHLYQDKDKTSKQVENLVVKKLKKLSTKSKFVLSNWHYAVWTPSGYIPQLSFERMEKLVKDR